ncbi:type IV secretion system protein VirD4 [Lachnospiraceae bacterium M18-1]|nr:type IV secretion system protein VirD4 [Lachnospiraceae bacterium M18-1]
MNRKQVKKKKAVAKPESTPLFKRLKGMIGEKMPVVDTKRLVMLNIPYVIVLYLVDKVAWLYRHCIGDSLIAKAGVLFLNFQIAFENPLPSLHGYDLLAGIAGAVGVKLIVYMKGKNAKKYRQGEEYGSARWGTPKDIAPFIDPVFENNILLTQTERLTMNSRPKLPKYARNKNVIIIGGSGSGKTRFYVKPQLMQMTPGVSYVVTDPKGTILVECGEMLKRGTPKMKDGKTVHDRNGKVVYEPYKIKVLNTINFKKSMHYNPFRYIRSEKDILKLVNTIIANTKGEGEKSSEDFWVKAERLLYCALIGYIYYEAPEEEQNFSTLLEFINASEAREDDEEFKNAVDELFEELEREKPEHFAVRQYKKYKLAAGKTAKSILISCGARLAPFDIAELRELTSYDEMELDMIGDQRTAMFIIISDTDDTFNFVVAIMYTQLFNLLCDRADDVHGGRLPYHVRLLLDEFSNIGQIPKFDKLIATIRSREISASIILQSQSQLKTIYKDAAETILGNCDTMLFLGGKEGSTLKEISENLGKETIDLYNTSDTRGQSRSYGLNYQKTGKELMSRDELAVMDGNKCILQLRGVRPFLSDKFDITRHKRYKELSDYDKKNAFDVEAYMKHQLKIRMREEFDLYEVDGSEADTGETVKQNGEQE